MSDKEWGVIEIHGVDYHTVAKRVADFRQDHVLDAGWSIQTKILDHVPDTYIVTQAEIVNPEGRIVATGHAYENANQLRNMAASMLEVAETSAVGRALAFAGLAGSKSEIASADEMQRRSLIEEGRMSKPKTTKIVNALVDCADKDDFAGCLEAWEELDQPEMAWINSQMDSVNRKKVGEAIKQGRTDRGDYDNLQTSEKDQRRVDQRAAS